MRLRHLFVNAALSAVAWSPAFSQANPPSGPRLGVIAGANLATFSSDFIPNASNRTGFAVGLMAVLPVWSSIAIQPELLLTRKGAYSKAGGSAKVDYVEIPMLARYEIRASNHTKLFVYGGPGLAFRTNCTIVGTIDCDYFASRAAEVEPGGAKFSRTDLDGIGGAGVAFYLGGRTMTVSARYDGGFVKLISYSQSKNRVLSFMGTVEWPFHK